MSGQRRSRPPRFPDQGRKQFFKIQVTGAAFKISETVEIFLPVIHDEFSVTDTSEHKDMIHGPMLIADSERIEAQRIRGEKLTRAGGTCYITSAVSFPWGCVSQRTLFFWR